MSAVSRKAQRIVENHVFNDMTHVWQLLSLDAEAEELWSVSNWLSNELKERGESVERATISGRGFNIWKRSGSQDVCYDEAIYEIAEKVVNSRPRMIPPPSQTI